MTKSIEELPPLKWNDAREIKRGLMDRGWKTPDTYAAEFGCAGNFSAVYLFFMHGFDHEGRWDVYTQGIVAYVGMSRNLEQRWGAHSILRQLKERDNFVQRWFCPVQESVLRETEVSLIQEFDPPWNIQDRIRGGDYA